MKNILFALFTGCIVKLEHQGKNFTILIFVRIPTSSAGHFRENIGSDEGIEDITEGQLNLTPKKLVRQNETDDENGLDEISNQV